MINEDIMFIMNFQRIGIEFILLMSIKFPWKALFFNLPFVFLNESPLVSFSLSKPKLPHSSAASPYFPLAWNELSLSSFLMGPTSSLLILEKDCL